MNEKQLDLFRKNLNNAKQQIEVAYERLNKITEEQIKKRKEISEKKKEAICKIFKHWNNQEILVHQKLTDEMQKTILRKLQDYSFGKVCTAIARYGKMYHDKKYFWDYKWSLVNFLSRSKGMPSFLDGGEKWENYAKDYVNENSFDEFKKG